jgi:hypothetical protein
MRFIRLLASWETESHSVADRTMSIRFTIVFEFATPHFVEDLLFGPSGKGWVATEENVEYHSTGPYIALLIVILPQNFWRDVERLSISEIE